MTGCAPNSSSDSLCERTILPHTSSIPSQWVYSNANVDYGSVVDPKTPMIANNGKLFFLSGWGRNGELITFDSVTGNMLWSKRTTKDLLFASSSIVLIGDCFSIEALDAGTGAEIWKTQFLKNCVLSITYSQGVLYVVGSDYYIIDAQTGEIIKKEAYTQNYDDILKDIAIQTGNPVLIGESFYLEDILYRREDLQYGIISAVNTDSSEIVWSSDYDYVSNLAISQNGLYSLTLDGQVMYLDMESGISYPYISLTPSQLNLVSHDSCNTRNRFYIAVDDHVNMLFLLLGDSNQMFAFQGGWIDAKRFSSDCKRPLNCFHPEWSSMPGRE